MKVTGFDLFQPLMVMFSNAVVSALNDGTTTDQFFVTAPASSSPDESQLLSRQSRVHLATQCSSHTVDLLILSSLLSLDGDRHGHQSEHFRTVDLRCVRTRWETVQWYAGEDYSGSNVPL